MHNATAPRISPIRALENGQPDRCLTLLTLHDAATAGNRRHADQRAQPVVDGLFTVSLAFPGAFNAAALAVGDRQRLLLPHRQSDDSVPARARRQPAVAAVRRVRQVLWHRRDRRAGPAAGVGATGAQGPTGGRHREVRRAGATGAQVRQVRQVSQCDRHRTGRSGGCHRCAGSGRSGRLPARRDPPAGATGAWVRPVRQAPRPGSGGPAGAACMIARGPGRSGLCRCNGTWAHLRAPQRADRDPSSACRRCSGDPCRAPTLYYKLDEGPARRLTTRQPTST